MNILQLQADQFRKDLDRLNSEKNNDDKIALIVRGEYDVDQSLDGAPVQSLIMQIAKTHRTVMKKINDATFFGQSIREAHIDSSKKISALFIFVHGRADRFQFGNLVPWYKFLSKARPLYQKKDINPIDFLCLEEDAKIYLFACSAGQGIARDIANISRRTVYAPMGFLYDGLTCLQNWPSPNLKLLSYTENNVQQMQELPPDTDPIPVSLKDISDSSNRESFYEMAKYIQEKAQSGEPASQLKLAGFYLTGKGPFAKSDNDAIEWLMLAAENGNSQAEFVLASCYFNGQGGLEKSIERASLYVRRAASQRFPSALLQMGLFFMNGWCGFQQSDEKAIACFRLAEKVRQPQAIFYLGNMYEQGRGVFRSLKIAKQKYIIAEQLGVSEAKDRLARILFSEEQQKLDNRRYCQIVGNHLYDVFQTIRECIDRAYSGCRNELKLANMAKI